MNPSPSDPWSDATESAITRLGPLALRDRRLSAYTTYRLGGPAAGLIEVNSVPILEEVRDAVAATGAKVLVVGRGSNLLVADRGFDGLVLHLGPDFEGTHIDEQPGADGLVRVRVGGAGLLPVLARRTVRAELTGFEWAVGVPGSVGGAIRMNAGGHGSDIAASLSRATIFDVRGGGAKDHSVDELRLGYRTSALTADQVVLGAELALEPGDRSSSERLLRDIVRWRREHQPGGQNAGSVFANPEGDSAGRLIEAAGLKGYRLGSAEVSTKHANFIQADPNGSADDVLALIRHVRDRVTDTFGVVLRPENHLVGFAETIDRPDDGTNRGGVSP